jgi:hypothetical protein
VIVDDNYEGEDIYYNYIFDLLNSKEIDYETYLDSVTDNPIFKTTLLDYKDFNKENLDYIANIGMTQKESLRLYCYHKFHHLEYFVAFITLTGKLELLDGKKTSS